MVLLSSSKRLAPSRSEDGAGGADPFTSYDAPVRPTLSVWLVHEQLNQCSCRSPNGKAQHIKYLPARVHRARRGDGGLLNRVAQLGMPLVASIRRWCTLLLR